MIVALLVVALSVVINYRATLFTRASADNSPLIAVLPISLASSFPQSQYWGNIHGRLLGLGVPILWTAALIPLLSYVRARIGDARTYIVGALAAIAVAFVACLAVADPPDPLPRLAT